MLETKAKDSTERIHSEPGLVFHASLVLKDHQRDMDASPRKNANSNKIILAPTEHMAIDAWTLGRMNGFSLFSFVHKNSNLRSMKR